MSRTSLASPTTSNPTKVVVAEMWNWDQLRRQAVAKSAQTLTAQRAVAPGMRNASTALAEGGNMLWYLVVALLVLWVLGYATAYTVGGVLHLLLLVALVLAVLQLVQGRRTV